jgi:hypothetical protein
VGMARARLGCPLASCSAPARQKQRKGKIKKGMTGGCWSSAARWGRRPGLSPCEGGESATGPRLGWFRFPAVMMWLGRPAFALGRLASWAAATTQLGQEPVQVGWLARLARERAGRLAWLGCLAAWAKCPLPYSLLLLDFSNSKPKT